MARPSCLEGCNHYKSNLSCALTMSLQLVLTSGEDELVYLQDINPQTQSRMSTTWVWETQ